MLTAFQQGKMGAQLDWLAPRSCVVVNSWWERLKIVQVTVILQWNLVRINSDKNVTKRNVQEFSDVVCNPCEPIVLPMLKPQASVTCQHAWSTDCQPQNVSNEHIFLEVVKFLSQLLTKRDAPAPVEGIKKFQPYLHNGKFTVVTDHSLHRWLMKVQNASGRLAKMGLSLATVWFWYSSSPW